MPPVSLIDPTGQSRDVPAESAQAFIDQGWRPRTVDDDVSRGADAAREADYGGVGGAVTAVGAGLARGVTVGGSDAIARLLGGRQAAADLSSYRDVNPGLSVGSEIAGALAPAFFTGGASAPAGAVSALGRGAAELAGGGLRGAIAGGVVEGGLYGLGSGVSDVALSQDPITLERIASTLSSNTLYGAGLGAGGNVLAHGISAGASAVERGLARAKPIIEEGAAAKAATDAVSGDLVGLDSKGLRAADAAERDALAASQAEQRTVTRSQAVDDVVTYRAAVKEANPWLAIDDEGRAPFAKSNKAFRGALDDVEGLRKNPSSLGKPLRKEAQVLEATLASRDEILAKLDAVNAKVATGVTDSLAALPAEATHVELSGKAAERYGTFADVRIKRGEPFSVPIDDAKRFVDAINSGDVKGATQTAFEKIGGLLEQNRALQAKIEGSTATALPGRNELTSDRLTAIANARDVLSMPKPVAPEPGMVEKAARGALFGGVTGLAAHIPILGQIPGVAHLVGAKGADAIAGLVFGRMGKATAEIAERSQALAKAVAGTAKAAEAYAPRVATQVLSAVRYAPPVERQRGAPEVAEPKSLAGLYKARTDEIKRQITTTEAGQSVMRPETRAQMAEKLKPIRVVDPVAADRIETLLARRMEYLASLIPRRPDYGTPQLGPDKWRPSDMQMRSFARSAAAVEDPAGVELRAAHGRIVPEDAAAYWHVYPERAQAFLADVLGEAATSLAKPPSFQQQLTIGILAQKPIHPAMNKRVINVLQSQFTDEVGADKGTAAPKAQPSFGSMQKSPDAPTPSQARAQGVS